MRRRQWLDRRTTRNYGKRPAEYGGGEVLVLPISTLYTLNTLVYIHDTHLL